jgi:hypothetical protein
MERLACFYPLAGCHPGYDRDLPHLAESGRLHVFREVAGFSEELLNVGAVGEQYLHDLVKGWRFLSFLKIHDVRVRDIRQL